MKQEKQHTLRLTLAFIIAMIHYSLMAQEEVSYEYNGIRVGDSIRKQQVKYVYAGDAGEDLIWDFSDMSIIKDFPVEFFCDSDSIFISELTPEIINKYSFCKDSLMLLGSETPLKRVDYINPIKLIVYPFGVNDKYKSQYSGTGLYCMKHEIKVNGDIVTEADGTGTLILSDIDTLKNTIRIHSIRTGSICMDIEADSTECVNNRIKQEIEERYQWYARGYRYPILETISTSYYDNMDLVSCIQTAYCYSPNMQHMLNDEQSEHIQQADSLSEIQKNKPRVINYSISATDSQINLTYSLTEDANITILVCNYQGMSYRRDSFSKPAGGEYGKTIDCSGLLPGTYILYLNVNGSVYSEKVKL